MVSFNAAKDLPDGWYRGTWNGNTIEASRGGTTYVIRTQQSLVDWLANGQSGVVEASLTQVVLFYVRSGQLLEETLTLSIGP